ncbi:MAG TPA: Gfo/Idh/MocA family oxidoreductase [Polyangiaceae bacterium]|jgi:predicted dehydrogenase|nr:Gfo/Idh/MocA family oxidoreductase [Polyangiaceae bacterium]
MASIKVGIVGTGGMANAHADNFKKIPGVELRACLDIVPGRAAAFADKHGISVVANQLDDLFSEVDAVALVTPDRAHHAGVLATLRAGKHLLAEKPLTVSLAEARDVAQEAKKAHQRGQVGLVNFSYRRSAALQKAIALARAGKLGEIRHAHGFYLQSWIATPIWGHWSNEGWLWRMQTAAGSAGVLGDIGCHLLDLATAVTGEVSEARCSLSTFPKLDPDGAAHTSWNGVALDANDSAIIELRFRAGGVGVLHTSRWATGHANHLRLEVHGTLGALRFDLDRSYDELELCLGKDRNKAIWQTKKQKPAPSMWQRFVRAIKRGEPEQPDLLRGAEIQAYLDACERSALSGKWEQVERL